MCNGSPLKSKHNRWGRCSCRSVGDSGRTGRWYKTMRLLTCDSVPTSYAPQLQHSLAGESSKLAEDVMDAPGMCLLAAAAWMMVSADDTT